MKKFLRGSTFKNTIIEFLQTYITSYRQFNVGGKILCPISNQYFGVGHHLIHSDI